MPDQPGRVLRGQVAVVTGGNRGIGAAIAKQLAGAGAAVVVAARHLQSLEDSAADIRAAGGDCVAVRCDVGDEDSVRAMGDEVYRRHPAVDIVVANAGVAGPTALMHDITYEQWRECVVTDLDGVFLTFRRFVPRMLARGSGCLVAISSMTGKRALYGRTPYAAAKMGVIGLVRSLAQELGPSGIRVNSICPGAVEGSRIALVIERQSKLQGVSPDAIRDQLYGTSPLRRTILAEDVAAACVFLASPAARSITGEDLNVSAGMVMY